ncbi:MAG: hypothetical protein M5U35_11930 [Roseovarius sp.]|nr:hypothetical protein [Roseovarius sp.]
MALSRQHELHKRRFSRNLGLGLVLGVLVVLFFGLTLVKVTNGNAELPPAGEVR